MHRSKQTRTFVLIHGGLRGGWAWKGVAQELRRLGHEAYHPTLDGCGDSKGSLRQGITLNTHGEQIANLLFYEDLRKVILVGTSIGGMVVCRAAELARERIDRLVFVSAVCPLPGEALHRINGRDEADRSSLVMLPGSSGNGRIAPNAGFTDLDPDLRAWALDRITGHPIAAAEDPVDLRHFWSQKWKVDVLRCTRVTTPSEAHQRRTAELLGASYAEFDSGHNVGLSHPLEIAHYLHSVTSN